MQPQALNNCWLLKSFCACPSRSASEEYQLHSRWLELRKTKRVNGGVCYKGKTSQRSRPQSVNRWAEWDQPIFWATAWAENGLIRWLMGKWPANDVSKHTASLRDIQKLAVPILHVGWQEELEWIKEGEERQHKWPNPVSPYALAPELRPVVGGGPHHSIHHGSKSLLLPTSNFHNAQCLHW